jgi:hypothetical protein
VEPISRKIIFPLARGTFNYDQIYRV